jgi:methionyl-tRNA synthetase
MEKLEQKFQEVKKFIYDHPDASVNDVSEANDVSVKQLKQWIREERLMFTSATATGIECEKCGAPIRSGRYCDKCKQEMSNSLSGLLDKPSAPESTKREKDGNRMRFLQ